MKYEVNIAQANGLNWNGTELKYLHWARVTLQADTDAQALAKLKVLRESFPSPDWSLRLTRWEPAVGRVLGA